MQDSNFTLVRDDFKSSRDLRRRLLQELYQTRAIQPQDPQVQILTDLTESFSRYAGNQQTAFDKGGSTSSAGTEASTMVRQVERAIAQVLGRSPGRSPDSFVSVLKDAFPISADGRQVVLTPSRSVVSLNSQAASNNTGRPGVVGQLSARQATLYRQSSLIIDDAIKVLAGLEPFSPLADLDQVEALRPLVRSTLQTLAQEFGRVEEPRPPRVKAYLDALDRHLLSFGRRGYLLGNATPPVSISDESMIAGYELLRNYTQQLRQIWNQFENSDRGVNSFSLSERIERAYLMLPIVSQSNNEFEAALESVGFLETERHSVALKFTQLSDYATNLVTEGRLRQEDITVYDLTEWLDNFASLEGPVVLADSGQYGLDFVTGQANSLFFVVAPVIGHLRTTRTPGASSRARLEQVLSNERVLWALDNLLNQLNGLADLAAPGGSPLT
jgi:hypothetical protein